MGTIPPAGRLYRFSALDAVAFGLYVVLAAVLTAAPAPVTNLVRQAIPDAATAVFAVNVAFYVSVGLFAVAAAWRVIARDMRILATRPWFTVAMIPVSIVAMLVLSAILVSLTGSARASQNQLGLQSLVQQLPPWYVVPLLVVLGPFVEEYLFRHLLIGKLSRHVNIWLCCALSVACFAAVHVVGREGLVLPALAPYLGMGGILVAAYVWTGKNVMFSYFIHASKNLLAVVLIYVVPQQLLGG
ncbi:MULTISPECIES: CPBP family intramembrane glutamic endopeptidase [Arthrobacter]|uniref:CPBP family intramembrane metalloprotease n=1 Tax=Arthrobacter terricola TaxID=2547396 RepID=A0A4R5KGU7_9MICC|nr:MULTISPECIES: CPBP family intramembrane glutamic endopeptidase [Arthrobacter]MBT8162121.1 CPBP family intramembrane metalloprotease [Arthrobacter sp. GN70]TDF93935.1 CPBP family intramembrane metalloprotease [Arthrobacter terricola]